MLMDSLEWLGEIGNFVATVLCLSKIVLLFFWQGEAEC